MEKAFLGDFVYICMKPPLQSNVVFAKVVNVPCLGGVFAFGVNEVEGSLPSCCLCHIGSFPFWLQLACYFCIWLPFEYEVSVCCAFSCYLLVSPPLCLFLILSDVLYGFEPVAFDAFLRVCFF